MKSVTEGPARNPLAYNGADAATKGADGAVPIIVGCHMGAAGIPGRSSAADQLGAEVVALGNVGCQVGAAGILIPVPAGRLNVGPDAAEACAIAPIKGPLAK